MRSFSRRVSVLTLLYTLHWTVLTISHSIGNRSKCVYRWRAWTIICKIPEAQREEVHLKASAAEALEGRRKEWGCRRRWKGDYMSLVRLLLFYSVYLCAK